MFKKFVQIMALFNFPVALGMIISVLIAPQADTLIITVVLGVSFMLMGAALLWATSDIKTRAPLIVWNGLVRMVGFITVTYAASLGLAPKIFVYISVMDLVAALVFVIGSMRVSGLSFKSLFLGKTQ
ncbi:hypothetical protein [Shewanella frigidimarina]|uniref:Uncharacterized protein n=1 Tax=Shewanella frigidimarina TaxID=56812 RepID=A0A106BWW6_SHEFR|nr:hypothetical protein [Shewanella frigidimarina]KVX00121.1 hypothetical protein AWJ07_09915 [Shewanella frigidimarina]